MSKHSIHTKSVILALGISVIFTLSTPGQDYLDLPGWTPQGETLSFNSENLWEHINGAADQFLDLGFQHLLVRDFKKESLAVSIEIYDMASDLNAFGIFALERPVSFQSLPIGSQAVLSLPGQALLLKNVFYVKMYAFEGELTEKTAKMLLNTIADKLPGHNQLPKEFQSLPDSGKIRYSEGFVRETFLGLNELQNCLYAVYKDDSGAEYRRFRIITESYAQSEAFFHNLPEKWIKRDYRGLPARMVRLPYQGMAAVVLTRQGLFGVSDCPDEESIIKRLSFLKNSP